MNIRLYGAGTLAYFPAMAGRVPCRVLAVEQRTGGTPPTTWQVLTVRVMSRRGTCDVGDVLTATGNNVIPRVEYVTLPGGRYRSADGWVWKASDDAEVERAREEWQRWAERRASPLAREAQRRMSATR